MKYLNLLISVCLFVLPLSACTTKKVSPRVEVQGVTISLDEKGTPVARDAKGNLLESKKVSFPVTRIKEIKNITHSPDFTVVEAVGSHYLLFGPPWYRYDLPHPQ
jgi:hypothetical protein